MKYKCTVSYIGKNYDGFQSQKNGKSIQEVIERAIRKITKEETSITSSGRTDAGVNAKAQVFMFTSDLHLSPYKWMGAINGFLPEDIHIVKCEEVNDMFHARFQVRRKTYCYRIHTGQYDVFRNHYVLQIPYALDLDAMKQCANVFVGTHDFTSYNATPLSLKPDQVRTIESIHIKEENDTICMYFTGKGFLRYQVRMMAGAILDVGRGYKTIKEIQMNLDEKSKTVTRQNISPSGLTLEQVDYYEMIAVDEKIQIRGFLQDDVYPLEKMNYQNLEEREIHHHDHRLYYICTRHEQQHIGYVEIDGGHAVIWLKNRNDQLLLEGIQTQMDDWFYQNQIAKISISEINEEFYQNMQKMI